ncbi:geraniol 8-hydroxylase isoform X1 [Arachis ipaensis]|uniref:geraniol 8-hydroxylase n=2 Tax=Arachis TaxID=3817 RepID=UPI0007AF778D|nr:geraniol 8-hydroxylase isoform X1 [Arachis ipaensis]XP_025634212.1 geraniol 8-hydroxylase [Arachis hypogaea]QHO25304.1 Geraniol 8-hydroxylase [Arachis hypogaea]
MDYVSMLLLLSFVLVTIHVLISNLAQKKSLKLPPGPNPFPIIGNILDFGNQPHQALAKLSQTYGPIMTMKLGNITTIVISSPQLAKEVLHKRDQIFSNRTIPDSATAHDHHKFSIVWLPPTTQWRSLRKFCATKVFSTQNLDSAEVLALRRKKVRELLDFVKEKSEKGETLDIGDVCFTTVLNSISNTFFSMDLAHYTSQKSQEFKDVIWGVMEEVGRPNVVDFFPMFRLLDPQGARTRQKVYFGKLLNFFDGLVEERLQSRSLRMESKDCKDVLDSVVDLILEGNSEVTRSHVLHLFLDLFVAGIDTTSSTIEWAMTELVHNSKKLVKVREELEQVLGKGEQQLEESHISKLPFLRAIVKETLRLHPPAPFLVPHRPEDDVELCGYMVPKNAQILTNVWAMGRDSSVWTNPNEFMPERFLESEIDFKGQNFELIPFGAGRRICPGLPLGFRSIHFVLASLLFEYDWKLPNNVKPEEMDMSEKYGLTLHKAQPLQVIPVSMHNNIK